jgi:DNA-binding transcriptional regulator YdaS (Cro superfamily)
MRGMKKQHAIDMAGGQKALAELLGITQSAVCQWGEDVPQPRVWQLQVIRPQWFAQAKRDRTAHPKAA